MSWISGKEIVQCDVVYEDISPLIQLNQSNSQSIQQLFSNEIVIQNEINNLYYAISNIDSNGVTSNISYLSNLIHQVDIQTSNNSQNIIILNNDIISLNIGYSNNHNDIYGLSVYSSNFALTTTVNSQVSSLNAGISNLSILSSNYAYQSQINSLNAGISNLSINSSNYAYQSQINSLNIGYSNNFDSITGLSLYSSNFALTTTVNGYVNSLNSGISNNTNAITGLSLYSSNFALTTTVNGYVNSFNSGISNNTNAITGLSLATSNFITANQNVVLTNKSMDYLTNTFINFPSGTGNGNVSTGSLNSNNYIPYWTSNFGSNLANGVIKPNGDLVGTTDTQVLTNKSMDYLTNTFTNFPTSGGTGTSNFYLNDQPVGAIIDYGGSSAPTNWLIADGREVSRTTYSVLFAVIGTTFGIGNGTTTFNLPDYSGRTSFGLGSNITLGLKTGNSNLFNSNLSSVPNTFVTATATGYSLINNSNYPMALGINKIIKYTTTNNSFTMSNIYTGSNNFFTSNVYYTSNNYTSNNYTSNNVGTNIQNIYNPYWGRVFMNTGYSNLVDGVWTDLPNWSISYGNVLNSFNTTTNIYTCPLSGLYRFAMGGQFINGSVGNDIANIRLLKNNSSSELLNSRPVIRNGTVLDLNDSDILVLNQGDTIKFQAKGDGTNTMDVVGAPYYAGGEDFTHFSWQLETVTTNTIGGSNVYTYKNMSSNQTTSNLMVWGSLSNELVNTNLKVSGGSNLGFNTSNAIYTIDCLTTDGIRIPKGTTAQRPVNSNDGIIRYNTSTSNYEGFSNNVWGILGGGTTSGSGNNSTATFSIGQSNIGNPYRVRAYNTALQTYASGSFVKISYGNETYDINNNFSTSTYAYTAPVDGTYLVSAQIVYGNVLTANQRYGILIYKNGTAYSEYINTNGSLTDYIGANITDTLVLSATNTVEIYAYQTSGGTVGQVGVNNGEHQNVKIHLIAPTTPASVTFTMATSVTISPTILNVSMPFRCRAFRATNQSINTGSFTKVQLANETFDYNNNFDNVTNYRYVCPIAGTYMISAQITYTSLIANKRYYVCIYKNNAAVNYFTNTNGTDTNYLSVASTDQIVCAVNDYIELFAFHEAGSTVTAYGEATGAYTFLNVYLLAPTTPATITFNTGT
jgi:microcystin-dependent protein